MLTMPGVVFVVLLVMAAAMGALVGAVGMSSIDSRQLERRIGGTSEKTNR